MGQAHRFCWHIGINAGQCPTTFAFPHYLDKYQLHLLPLEEQKIGFWLHPNMFEETLTPYARRI
jgi:hypothetical protein